MADTVELWNNIAEAYTGNSTGWSETSFPARPGILGRKEAVLPEVLVQPRDYYLEKSRKHVSDAFTVVETNMVFLER